jgi:RecB family endonuclease NucS
VLVNYNGCVTPHGQQFGDEADEVHEARPPAGWLRLARSTDVGELDGVEQLTRYLDLLNRDPLLAPVQGVFAAQQIKPQARTLAEDRGIRCVTLDYDALRGTESNEFRRF